MKFSFKQEYHKSCKLLAVNSIIIILLFTGSCNTINVTKISTAKKPDEKSLVYALPQTVLRVEAELTKTTTLRGPYYQFAEKYLGITTVPDADKTEWKISSISIDQYAEPDSAHYYCIHPAKCSASGSLNLTADGRLVSVNAAPQCGKIPNSATDVFLKNSAYNNSIFFTDLTVKKNVAEFQDTVYKRISDSSHVRVPVIKKNIDKKSINQKAEEAANFIIKIRKNRFNIVAGKKEKFPADGKSIEEIIKEFDSLEAEYLSLFIGKTLTETYRYSFEYTPGSKSGGTPFPLFYLSPGKGLVPENDKSGEAVMIQVTPANKTDGIDNYLAKRKAGKPKKHGLYYRVPDYGLVKIMQKENILATKKTMIAQFGSVVNLHPKFLKSRKTVLEFDTEYGSLISITKKHKSRRHREPGN